MPRIGLLSDSHGRASTTLRAVKVLTDHGVDMLVHLGDVGTVEVIDALLTPGEVGGAQVPVHLVFGNTDWDAGALGDYARDLGMTVDHPVGRLSLEGEEGGSGSGGDGGVGDPGPALWAEPGLGGKGGGGELVFTHGHLAEPMERAITQRVRYLCHGHTHRASDTRRGATRIINPGALFRASRYTVAVLDTAADEVTFLGVGEGE